MRAALRGGPAKLACAVAAAALITACVDGDGSGAGAAAENVILISLDTLRADHLGAYGYPRPTSPCIDRFASESTLFEASYAHASWTLPSHMSIFTSLHPSQHGVTHDAKKLGRNIPLLAEILSEAGLSTGAFTAGYYMQGLYGFDRGFDVYREKYDKRASDPGWRIEHLRDDLFAWLGERRGRPFFAFVHSYDVHEPFIAHDYLQEFAGDYDGPLVALHSSEAFDGSELFETYRHLATDARMNINRFLLHVVNEGRIELSAADKQHLVDLYDNEIRYADDAFCSILEELERLDLLATSVVILTSDHGQELLERGRVVHEGVHEEVLRVPLVIRVPGRAPARRGDFARGIDIAPTVLGLLGLPPNPGFRGRDLFDPEAEEPGFVIAESVDQVTLRSHDWRLILSPAGRELYDLTRDPGETSNVEQEHPAVVADLEKKLLDALDRIALSDDDRAALRALGYVD